MTVALKNVDQSLMEFLLANLLDMHISKSQSYSKKFIQTLKECEEELISENLKT